MNNAKGNPTTLTYTSLNTTYDYLNRELFSGMLPPCLITMQRHKGAYGFFSGERFANTTDPADVADEIALNPVHFATRRPTDILSTLAHEMTHLWQHHYGRRPRKSYHDKQWAAKMREIGLIPTDTGEIGGKETGQKVSQVIDADGKFAKTAATLLKDHPAILYHDRSGDDDEVRKKKAASKTKYTCPGCGLNAWAEPAAPLVCGDCEEPMHAEETTGIN